MKTSFDPVCFRMLLALGLLSALALLIGCEQAPPTNYAMVASSDDFVVKDSQLKSDWNLSDGEFLVERQSQFLFFRKADRELIQRSLERIETTPSFVSEKPKEIDEVDYAWLSRFVEPAPELRWISIHDSVEDPSADAFSMASDGAKLVTVGNQIRLWDSSTGQQLAKLQSPLASAKQVSFDKDATHLFVGNSDEIVKQNIESGQVVNRWKSTKAVIVKFVKARDLDVIAALTKEGDVVVLDSELNRQSGLKLERPFNLNIAINATGKWVLASTPEGIVRWNVESRGQAPQIVRTVGISLENAMLSSGDRIDRCISGHKAIMLIDGDSFYIDKSLSAIVTKEWPILLGNSVRYSHSATVDGSQDWLVSIGTNRDQEGNRFYQVQDWDWSEFNSSVPQRLNRESIADASFDRVGERIALKTEKGIEVVARRRWIDSDGAIVKRRVLNLFETGEFERLESCAALIRKLGRKRFRRTGAEHWDELAHMIGNRWAELHLKGSNDEFLQKAEKWENEKSDLALLSSLVCAKSFGDYLRYPNSNLVRSNIETLLALQQTWSPKSKKISASLLASSDPTPACFAYALYEKGKNRMDYISECDSVLKECVEKWPTCEFPHRIMLEILRDLDGPTSSECYPYVSSLSGLLPTSYPLRPGFTLTCLSVRYNDDWFLLPGTPFTSAQLKSIGQDVLSNEPTNPWKFEQWFYLGATTFYIPNTNGSVSNSKGLKLKDFNSDMIRYHQRHYEMPRRYFYRFGDAPKLYSEYMDSLNL